MQQINFHIPELDAMKHYPEKLFYKGNSELLHKKKIAIVGSRKPNQYAREVTHRLSHKLSLEGVCIVSGGALGVDAIAHKAAGAKNTIMVAATGLDKRYPAINKNIIADIEINGLVLSQFEEGTPSRKYHFPLRNEIVVALGDVLVVTYADFNSGTMRSVEYALKMGKEVYVLPHRIGESEATNNLLAKAKAKAIYNLDAFVAEFAGFTCKEVALDEFLHYCQSNPTYEEALQKYPTKIFEAELAGTVEIKNARVYLSN
ncbi:DNA-processing protein DprA [Sulfurimonas sp. NW9]|uniref:DNA-processing protein DprA n=1 Tax=Sulfurimonas sp. NW9 TaxID=2922728 RepID=UPI003DA9C63D